MPGGQAIELELLQRVQKTLDLPSETAIGPPAFHQKLPRLTSLDNWYAGLAKYSGGMPARGTLGGALAVAEALKTNFNLDLESHTAKGGSQIKGASGARLGWWPYAAAAIVALILWMTLH